MYMYFMLKGKKTNVAPVVFQYIYVQDGFPWSVLKRLEVLRHNLETQFDPLFFLFREFLQILFVKYILSRPSHTEEKKVRGNIFPH